MTEWEQGDSFLPLRNYRNFNSDSGDIMSKKLRDENTDMFMKAVMSSDNIEECYDFFRDLCTDSEIKAMSERFQVARMLREHRMYSDIVRETQVGTATISRVNNNLLNGTGGYERAIDRAERELSGGELCE